MVGLSVLSPALFHRCRGPSRCMVRSQLGRLCSLCFVFLPQIYFHHTAEVSSFKKESILYSQRCVCSLCRGEFPVQMLTTWAALTKSGNGRDGWATNVSDRQGGTSKLRTYMRKSRSRQQYWLTRSPYFQVFVLALQAILILNHKTRVRSTLLF